MKIWAKLVNVGHRKMQGCQFVQVREWECTDKDIPPGFIPEHGFVSFHEPTTGCYLGWAGSNWATERLIEVVPFGLPTKFLRITTNTEPVYKHCRKYEMV